MDKQNQSIKADAGKAELHLVPPSLMRSVAYVRSYGVEKYGDKENWKEVDILRYYNAAMRHLLDWASEWDGKHTPVDFESGLPTLWHVACNIAFMIELEKYL